MTSDSAAGEPPNPQDGRLSQLHDYRIGVYEAYIRAAAKSGKAGKLVPSTGETERGIALRVSRAAAKIGVPVRLSQRDGAVYFTVGAVLKGPQSTREGRRSTSKMRFNSDRAKAALAKNAARLGVTDGSTSRPATRSAEPISHPLYLDWEVLPPGQVRRLIGGGFGTGPKSDVAEANRPERLRLLEDLAPTAWYTGSHLGQRLYLVALFDRVAIAESAEYGNALYYCPVGGDSWKTIFRADKQRAIHVGAKRSTTLARGKPAFVSWLVGDTPRIGLTRAAETFVTTNLVGIRHDAVIVQMRAREPLQRA